MNDLFGNAVQKPVKPKRPWRFEGDPALRTLSLGAGTQSSTMLYLALHGIITPRPDAAIFADTGCEPQAVYDHLEYLQGICEQEGLPLYRVSAGNLLRDNLASKGGKRFAAMPLYTPGKNTRTGQLKRQCTTEYKITPITQQIRRLLGLQKGERIRRSVWVESWIGISQDEIMRMKTIGLHPYIRNRHPLIELGMRRQDCIEWTAGHGDSRAPKSSCLICPYHDDRFWGNLKQNSPGEFAGACEFDREIRHGLRGVEMPAYLHSSLIPLEDVVFSTDDGQDGLFGPFGAECSGVCGV